MESTIVTEYYNNITVHINIKSAVDSLIHNKGGLKCAAILRLLYPECSPKGYYIACNKCEYCEFSQLPVCELVYGVIEKRLK